MYVGGGGAKDSIGCGAFVMGRKVYMYYSKVWRNVCVQSVTYMCIGRHVRSGVRSGEGSVFDEEGDWVEVNEREELAEEACVVSGKLTVGDKKGEEGLVGKGVAVVN